MKALAGLFLGGGILLFAALPGTGNYQLRDYGFGSGGGTASSGNYSLEGLAGDIGYNQNGTTSYGLRPGLLGSQLANLPDEPVWQNPNNWYNRLQLIIQTSGNPDDTTYAVAISDDNFATTRYVQSDSTVGPALGPEDFRDYAGWGSGSGMSVIGLQPDTTYQVKVKARQGEFSETGFGPTATAATAQASVIFDIDIASSDSESAPPYAVDFGDVLPGTVTDSPELIWLDLDSNADNGVFVYVVSSNDGLQSAATGYTIDAVTGDLGSLNEGIGTQNSSVSETGGGPLVAAPPYDGTSSSVGSVDAQYKQLLGSSGPVSSGRASFILKLKTTSATPAAADYVDVYTFIATAGF